MKKLLSGFALATTLAVPAMAADLPVKAPVAVPYVAMYNWSGFYIGGHAGYGSGDVTVSAGGFEVSRDGNGFVGGLQTGFNWQSGRWVFGIEGSVSFFNNDDSGACAFAAFPAVVTCDTEVKHFWRAGGRVGIAAGDTGNWLLYATGGFARLQFKTSGLTAAGVVFESNTVHHHGWYGGAGFEWGVAPNFTIGVEGYYASLGNESQGIVFTRNVDIDFFVVQARASYKFNWGSPVVARY
jgi:outer membrane immunogenic protein